MAPSEEVADDMVRLDGSAGLDVTKHRGCEQRAGRSKHDASALQKGLARRGPFGSRNRLALPEQTRYEVTSSRRLGDVSDPCAESARDALQSRQAQPYRPH